MNQRSTSDSTNKAGHLSPVRSAANGQSGKNKKAVASVRVLGERAIRFGRELPKTIEREVRENPLRTVGLAAAIGFGGGIVLGSRIMRSVAGTVAVYAISQFANTYVKRAFEDFDDVQEAS